MLKDFTYNLRIPIGRLFKMTHLWYFLPFVAENPIYRANFNPLGRIFWFFDFDLIYIRYEEMSHMWYFLLFVGSFKENLIFEVELVIYGENSTFIFDSTSKSDFFS